MRVANPSIDSADPTGKSLYLTGGISALVLGCAYLAIFPLFARVGAPPVGDGEVWLKYLAGNWDRANPLLGRDALAHARAMLASFEVCRRERVTIFDGVDCSSFILKKSAVGRQTRWGDWPGSHYSVCPRGFRLAPG
jgi:hypothetical protein